MVSAEILDQGWNAHVRKVRMVKHVCLAVANALLSVADFTGIGCQYELDACKAEVCQNGASCVDYENGYQCACAPGRSLKIVYHTAVSTPAFFSGFTGQNCEVNLDDCTPSPCPLAATCIDQQNSYYCQCPFNMTGANCDKVLVPDYDIRFYDTILPASAGLSVPFLLQAKELTFAMWVRFEQYASRGTFFTLYKSQ